MRIGIIADVHGNLNALEKCFFLLKEQQVDKIFFLGDAIGYYPYGIESLTFLKDNKIACLMGNHEAMLLNRLSYPERNELVYRLNPIKENISAELLEFIGTLSPLMELELSGKRILMVHGSPSDPLSGYVYPNSELGEFDGLRYDVVFMAHTHIPFIKKYGNMKVINVGSCGMPRDNGNYSAFCVYDSESGDIDVLRTKMNDSVYRDPLMQSVHQSVLDLYQRNEDNFFGKKID